MKVNLLVATIILLISTNLSAQADRGASVKPNQNSISSDKRVALVIGNSAYADAPLKNPVNDA